MTSSEPSPSTTVDVESGPAAAGVSGGSCCAGGRGLTSFLLGSVLVLYALVLAGGALGLLTLQRLRADMAHEPAAESAALLRASPPQGSAYKMQNFAHLRATDSRLKHGVMHWEPILYGGGNTVGSKYIYDSKQAALEITQEGSYFLYVQVTINCVYKCSNGTVSIEFEVEKNKELSCTLSLPETPSKSTSKKCWTVIPHVSAKSRLLARMNTNHIKPEGWSLDLNQSEFGMFLVDKPEQDA